MNIFETDDNSTPLTEEEKQQLKAKCVTTRSELNEPETKGIADADRGDYTLLINFAK